MKKPDLSRHAPPGLDLKWERSFFVAGWVISHLVSLTYWIQYFNCRSDLYIYLPGGSKELDASRVMADFYVILGSSLKMYVIFAVCMLLLAVYHYLYHHMGTKSIYTMRRLPNKWELHRRCLTLPICCGAILLVSAAVTLLFRFGLYMLLTPKQCLAPDQWAKLWKVVF